MPAALGLYATASAVGHFLLKTIPRTDRILEKNRDEAYLNFIRYNCYQDSR